MKMNKKGFTLIEMLVVIAIIAVLVAIVIPVVGNSTEAAKEAADAANIRAAISEVTTKALMGEHDAKAEVTLTQDDEFKENEELLNIGGFDTSVFTAAKGTKVTITYCEDCNSVLVQVGEADAVVATGAHVHTTE